MKGSKERNETLNLNLNPTYECGVVNFETRSGVIS